MFQNEVPRSYSVPAKIFILGEYAVLEKKPALVAATAPRFTLEVREGSSEAMTPGPSPLGRLIEWVHARGVLPSGVSFEFHDPFHGQGGFGASTAEFALGYAALADRLDWDRNWKSVLKLYLELVSEQGKRPPSGADLVAQWTGGVAFYDPQHASCLDVWSALDWSGLLVFSATHQAARKVATHRHLDELAGREFELLKDPLWKGLNAIHQRNAAQLGEALNAYADALAELGLEIEATREDRRALRSLPGVLGVKGAGALQSDAVLVWMKEGSSAEEVIRAAGGRNLKLVSQGLKRQMGIQCQN